MRLNIIYKLCFTKHEKEFSKIFNLFNEMFGYVYHFLTLFRNPHCNVMLFLNVNTVLLFMCYSLDTFTNLLIFAR